MSTLTPALIQSHKPASFMERGVAVPFTSPQLAGARIRLAERTGTEFVVPNPAGGRGVYILHWGGIRQVCRPTVHDTLLHQRISRLTVLDPQGVRAAARQLAAEGHAGKDAAIAAPAAAEADRQDLIQINFLLLITLMEQTEPSGLRIRAETERTPELDRRARRVVTHFGATIGRSLTQVSQDLESLSALFVSTGLDTEAPPARLPRLTERLDTIGASLSAWAKKYPNDSFAGLAASLGKSAHVTATCAAATLRATRAMTAGMASLLQAWAASPAEVTKQVSRPDWLLDGWDRFCLLWETAADLNTQRAVLPEMAQLVPPLPKEGADWSDERRELENLEPVLQGAQLNATWRGGGAAPALIVRNERLQALIA
jgi:hypothetical protein